MAKEILTQYLLMFGGGFLLYVLITFIVRLPGKGLQLNFQSLGDMKGMDKSEIIKKCGSSQSIEYIEGGSVCVWNSTGYLISLVFDSNNKVVKINQEVVS